MPSLPAEFFRRRGVCVIVKLPLSESDDFPIENLHIIKGAHTFLPLFTSEAAAGRYAEAVFGGEVAGLAPVSFDNLRKLGNLLDAMALEGCEYVVFDPDPAGSDSLSIHDVAEGVRDHLNRFSAN